MIENNELEKRRMSIHEAPLSLVMPFTQVVSTAMSRVREGEIDDMSRQSVSLRFEPSGRVYKIMDVSVARTGMMGRKVVSVGRPDSGLFISGVQLDIIGEPVSQLTDIQIPRNPGYVNRDSLFLQRSTDPLAAMLLAAELHGANKIPMSEYEALVRRTIFRQNMGLWPVDSSAE